MEATNKNETQTTINAKDLITQISQGADKYNHVDI